MRSDRVNRRRLDLRRSVERVLRDRKSGAAQIAATVADILADAKALGYSPDRLTRLEQRIIRAHPAMGSVWYVVNAEDPRNAATALRAGIRTTIERARATLPRSGAVITLSYSSSVVAALARRKRRAYRAYVAESLPGGEGTRTARALRRVGVETEVVADTELVLAASRASFGIIGADAVTTDFVINKVGSHLLALACHACGVPFYVVADSSKFVPQDWEIPPYEPDHPFEPVPRVLATEIISDRAPNGAPDRDRAATAPRFRRSLF